MQATHIKETAAKLRAEAAGSGAAQANSLLKLAKLLEDLAAARECRAPRRGADGAADASSQSSAFHLGRS